MAAALSVRSDPGAGEPRSVPASVREDAAAAFSLLSTAIIDPPGEDALLAAGWSRAASAAGIEGRAQRSDDPMSERAVSDDLKTIFATAPGSLSDDLLIGAYIRGMLEAVDQSHTGFFQDGRIATGDLDDEPSLATYFGFTGLAGADGLRVWRVDARSPAERAGLRVGDVILSINGQPAGIEAAPPAAGEALTVLVRRDGTTRTLRMEPVEGDIQKVLVEEWDNGICFMRIDSFFELTRDLPRVKRCAEQSAGIILDLRGNPGGAVTSAAEVAGSLGLDGVFVTLEAQNRQRADFRPRSAPARTTPPLVILVDRESRSGAEILPFALRESLGAVILGEQTSGYARAARTFQLNHGVLYVPLNRVFSPVTKTDIEGIGVTPDEAIPLDFDLLKQGRDNVIERAEQIILSR